LELLPLRVGVKENEVHFSAAVGFRAQIWQELARVKKYRELKTFG